MAAIMIKAVPAATTEYDSFRVRRIACCRPATASGLAGGCLFACSARQVPATRSTQMTAPWLRIAEWNSGNSKRAMDRQVWKA